MNKLRDSVCCKCKDRDIYRARIAYPLSSLVLIVRFVPCNYKYKINDFRKLNLFLIYCFKNGTKFDIGNFHQSYSFHKNVQFFKNLTNSESGTLIDIILLLCTGRKRNNFGLHTMFRPKSSPRQTDATWHRALGLRGTR